MTAHPMTHRARLLAEESGERWLILSLCDALDAEHEYVNSLRAQLNRVDEVAA